MSIMDSIDYYHSMADIRTRIKLSVSGPPVMHYLNRQAVLE
jgi:hypothetical protein